mgnify:CR=1 FL=1|tara:strand:- start:327 stop:506 length:180 start_codon:yes stop_codon:yes gene_type:complete
MKNKNWKDKLINLINKISKKKGWSSNDSNPFFYQIHFLNMTNAKSLREYKQQQKQKENK